MSLSSEYPSAPPAIAIELAIQQAILSPCVKSKRGVVIYGEEISLNGWPAVFGSGFNSPPADKHCEGSEGCKRVCNKLCIHAEMHAIYEMIQGSAYKTSHMRYLLHVKVVDGTLIAGGPPSCWSCASMILGCRIPMRVWLYEDLWEGPKWTLWDVPGFYESTMLRQEGHSRYAPRNSIETDCGGCGKRANAKRDRKGFWRCLGCGYPSP